MQEHEYKARDKTVQKMSRDGLREENLHSKKEKRITGREADEKKIAGHRENTDCSPDTFFWNRKKLRKRKKWKTQK